jgi:small multidrug resistance family-3 protein
LFRFNGIVSLRAKVQAQREKYVTGLIWLAMTAAALAEVGGDALIRYGLRGHHWLAMVGGGLVLAAYGVLVNLAPWDFSTLLGVYVAFFAVVSIGWGCLLNHDPLPLSKIVGLGLIISGSMVIQFGLPFVARSQ